MKNVYPIHPLLLIDDEEYILQNWAYTLTSRGINNIILCSDSRNVNEIVNKNEIEVILLDLSLPYISGQELLTKLSNEHPEIPVIIITGMNDVDTAVECMKSGAFDYMVKAVEENKLISVVKGVIELRELERINKSLKNRFFSSKLENLNAFEDIITTNKKMNSIFLYIEAVAKTSKPVLITGETGTGKELIAHAVHRVSARSGKYIVANVAGFDDTMFSDTLFGHRKGAYTGAQEARQGLIEMAVGGTVFLDEIGDLSISSQVKLLRLFETNEYYPLGSDVSKRSKARFVAATNRDIHELVRKGQFRKDLYYRLSIHEIEIPPLRERKEDIALLTDYFVSLSSKELKKQKPTLPSELYTLLEAYHFPGNIRELKSMIFDAISHHKSGILSLKIFRHHMEKSGNHIPEGEALRTNFVNFSNRLPTIKQITELLIEETLQRSKGNQSIASQILGISQQALSKRLIRKGNHSHN
jgi:DNA-binding NtrC family response regulator